MFIYVVIPSWNGCIFQECVFEDLGVKQKVFKDIEGLVREDVILSSSTSCLVPSDVFSKVQNRSRCLVSHPVSELDRILVWSGRVVNSRTLTVSIILSYIPVYWLFCALQVNPPYYVKLVELVPHLETAAVVMDTTRTLMTKVKLITINERKLFYILCCGFYG